MKTIVSVLLAISILFGFGIADVNAIAKVYTDSSIGRDKWTGKLEDALRLLGYEISEGADVHFADRGWDTIRSGDEIMMVSGRNKVGDFVVAISSGRLLAVRKYAVIISGVEQSKPLYQNIWCNNWLTKPKKAPVEKEEVSIVGVSTPTEIISPVEIPMQAQDIFVPFIPQKPPQCRDFELTAATGMFFGGQYDMQNWWGYGEGMFWDSCWYWSRGVGFYVNGDMGSVNSHYEWDHLGYGPQIGLRYQDNAKNEDGTIHPYGITGKLRLILTEMNGKNHKSSYGMTQEDLMLGLYNEYVRELEKGLIAGVSFEGWISLLSSIDSSWSGDSVSNRASLELKAFIQKKISDDWQVRGGPMALYQFSDYLFGVGPFGEFRYHEWLMIGASAYYLFPGFIYGPSIRVEGGNYVRHEREQEILNGIWAVDELGNPIEESRQCGTCNQ